MYSATIKELRGDKIKLKFFDKFLLEKRLKKPTLNVLESNANTCEMLLFQPRGELSTIDENGNYCVKCHDKSFIDKFSRFIDLALETEVDLVP